MTAIVSTTELEAVNIMLDCINEAPVSSLTGSGLVDVAKAKDTLSEVSREVQEKGWHFNTEYDYPLTRDVDGYIPLATNMARVDVNECYTRHDAVQRGARLYWLNEHTYVFDQDLEGEVIFYLPWTDLPQAARQYITIRAARRFQGRQLGSDTKHKFSETDEMTAMTSMQRSELNSSDVNMLNSSYSVYNILGR